MHIYMYSHIHTYIVPPGGTEVDMMRVDRLLQSMTRVGARAESRKELPALLYSYNCVCIYIDINAYMHAYIRIHTHICIYTYIINIYIYTHIHIHIYTHIDICAYGCVYA